MKYKIIREDMSSRGYKVEEKVIKIYQRFVKSYLESNRHLESIRKHQRVFESNREYSRVAKSY